MDKKLIEPYLHKEVNIGIPHLHESRLFYFSGKILDMDHEAVLLEIKKGERIKKLFYEQIMEIKERGK